MAGEEERKRILEEMHRCGANGFPFVKIGKEVVIGYNPGKYSELMDLSS